MRHTPGPWEVERDGKCYWKVVNQSIGVVATVNEDEDVAEANGIVGELDANARLIAAAPDMYRELRVLEVELAGWLEEEGLPAHVHSEVLARWSSVRAVLKGAHGAG